MTQPGSPLLSIDDVVNPGNVLFLREEAVKMPHMPSPAEYVSSESQCDTYLTSDTEQSTSDGPIFPAWHRARCLNRLSDVALCPKLSQLRAYTAFSEQTAAEQLSFWNQILFSRIYSWVSDKGGPIILEREEYLDILKQSVSWNEQSWPKKATLPH